MDASVPVKEHPGYTAWTMMKQRCSNPNSKDFKSYGGRGITFDPAWTDYRNFLNDMGHRPEGTTLDREDNDLGYTKANCRWSTPSEQGNNRRDNHLITHLGETLTLSEWARRKGVSFGMLKERLRRGWDVDLALITPSRKRPRCPTPTL